MLLRKAGGFKLHRPRERRTERLACKASSGVLDIECIDICFLNSRITGDYMRGKITIFIDGNNLFHAARSVGVEIDYAKFLNFLRGNSPLLRAFFYTGVDEKAERQQGFLLWMRRNGYRVVEKELKTYADGTKKANLDVEIAVDMLSLADKYDTAVLVSGDEDFAYAINAVAYKGVRVELAGFRSNTSPRLIDVADQFIELDSHIEEITKTESRYNSHDRHSGSHYVQTRPSGALNSGAFSASSLSGGMNNSGSLNTGSLNAGHLNNEGYVRVHDERPEAEAADASLDDSIKKAPESIETGEEIISQ